MHAYRFRMLNEEQEDFLRDFDILSKQTFADLHNLIKQAVELSGNELASFFVCDPNWRKKREITLINMHDDSDLPPEDDEDDRRNNQRRRIPVSEMDKVRIKDVIDDPHQRLLYEYDFMNPKVFLIELMRIIDANNTEAYPICVKSNGKFITTAPTLPVDDIDNEDADIALMAEFDDILDNDDDEGDEFPDMAFDPETPS